MSKLAVSFTLLLAIAGLAVDVTVQAQEYPARPIRIVVPFAPGGGTDVFARVMGQRLQEAFAQSVVVDNRAGAGGTIGTELVAKSPPDGLTLMFTTTAVATNVTLYPRLAVDPLKDLVPITQLGSTSSVLCVHPSVPARTVQDVVALSKRTRGGLNFASNGPGTSGHLAGAMFVHLSGARLTHIPYKGAAPAITDALGGHVPMLFDSTIAIVPHLKAGKLIPIAVTGATRSPQLPDVPTFAEAGYPDFDAALWEGVLAPAGTPAPIIAKLNTEINRAIAAPEVKAKLAEMGADVVGTTPEQFGDFIRSEITRWSKVVKPDMRAN
jgi:tripartite-type tricarboxylate transporter receptor subunit TctC